MTSSLKVLPSVFLKMAESFENLPDWKNEDLEKSLAEAVDSYDKQEEEKKTRFSVENDLTKLLEQSQSNATKRNTKWVVKLFQDWCQERNIITPLLKMNTTELDQNLARFYVEARTKKGEEYSRSALLGFRNSIERHLNNNGVTVKLSKNQVFQNSNKILDAKLRINRRAGKENIQHKPVIVPSDLAKIRASPFLSMTTPAGLLRRTWFYVSLYWCRRGREGQRDLRRDSFKFTRDASGREYAVMTHEEATKNHPGGENSKSSAERETRLYSTGEDDDAFASLKGFVSKLNPSCSAFFQHPKQSVNPEDAVWYENRPLGVNKLGEMMKTISVGAKLSQLYTNHSVRASAITLLSDANVPDRHIMFISGHSSEQSIAHYSSRPSVSQLENVSDTISNALENQQPQSTQISTVTTAPLIQSSNRMASNVSMSTATASFPSGFFNSCNIQGNVQVFFGLQTPSDDKK
ncbi:uncharacterized protein [Acropora muricata]|uniref:uncharacterized protein n=1 Tax=Acropora muricata TaxID=159855 RepID=UPI0034E4C33C